VLTSSLSGQQQEYYLCFRSAPADRLGIEGEFTLACTKKVIKGVPLGSEGKPWQISDTLCDGERREYGAPPPENANFARVRE